MILLPCNQAQYANPHRTTRSPSCARTDVHTKALGKRHVIRRYFMSEGATRAGRCSKAEESMHAAPYLTARACVSPRAWYACRYFQKRMHYSGPALRWSYDTASGTE
jgi:hypothetical protein